jgi:hypothetical protein
MMSMARQNCSFTCTAALLAALALGGCSTMGDTLPEKLGGIPESAPRRTSEPMAFPNVYETQPPRDVKALTADEQQKLETDLMALRQSQLERVNPSPPGTTKPPAKKAEAKAKNGTKPLDLNGRKPGDPNPAAK